MQYLITVLYTVKTSVKYLMIFLHDFIVCNVYIDSRVSCILLLLLYSTMRK